MATGVFFNGQSSPRISIIAGVVLASLVGFIIVAWQIWCLAHGKRSIVTCCMKPRRVKWRKKQSGIAKHEDHEMGFVGEGMGLN